MARPTTKAPQKKQDDDTKPSGTLTLVKGTKGLVLRNGKTRANVEAMRKAAEILEFDAPATRGAKSDLELLGNLRGQLAVLFEDIPVDDRILCKPCGEISTAATPFCPFCGDEGEPEGATDAADEVDPTVEEPASDDDEEAEEDADTEEEDEAEEDEAEEDEAEEEPEKPEPAAKAAPAKKGRPAKAIVPAKNVDAAIQAQGKELDAKVERIITLKKSAVGLSYDIGLECRDIRDQQLFKARGYSSFKAFADKELPFTRESALQLISIVEKHTREEYEQIGYSKLRAIAAVNDTDAKAELIQAARAGATTRELTEKVTGKPDKPTNVPAREQGTRITLLGKIGAKSQAVKLHDAKSGDVVPTGGQFVAKSVTREVYGELEISDGVFLRIGLRVSEKQELTGFSVRYVRSSEDE